MKNRKKEMERLSVVDLVILTIVDRGVTPMGGWWGVLSVVCPGETDVALVGKGNWKLNTLQAKSSMGEKRPE
jgi:hypothetical protein